VFEATARHASFSRAAEEMNVTKSAISRQIKALEDELGIKLFIREKNGVQLTAAAQDLFAEISASFSRWSETIRTLTTEKPEETVTLACTEAFATLWLMPRMASFSRRFPEITVNFLIPEKVGDYRGAEVDLFIRPATGAWPNEHSERLYDDIIYPVCGLGFAEEYRDSQSSSIWKLPLLHLDWTNPNWPRWQDFFQAKSITYKALRGQRFAKYTVLLAAAEANQGLAIGWDAMVRPLIDQGKLVRFSDLWLQDPIGFCLAWSDRKPLSHAARALQSWLREQARPKV
jgi:DNA-binding transcriptional LysR family regulator